MAIPELSTLSKKTQEVVNMIFFENFSVNWPMLVKHSRSRMKEDLNAVGGNDVATLKEKSWKPIPKSLMKSGERCSLRNITGFR